ncbi:MAG: (deoxy)nucleoside triphosphate pyrophosphohydrolase [Clostridiales bacterium]|nr:(deoxy)nucleoside triphosphate pyrophosphohydrolase [Clostridiales bacterium]
MKIINVVAAIIVRDGKILATQRGYGEYKDGWEFPGGKIEPGELPEDALVREISEELDASIEVEDYLTTVEHDYSDFHLSMQCFFASLKDDSHLKLLEHEASRWLSFDELDDVDWLPADIKVVEALKERGF